MKIVTVIGARPQFIKAAVVSREIRKHNDIEEIIIHTGQHFDNNMSDIFFEQLDIPKPDYNLNINGLNHGAMTGQMLEEIEKVLLFRKPNWVLVYGDTNSTLAGALAAKKMHIKVAHIEAGLRSFNMNMPEEINRILTDRISDILFCPTDNAVENLKKEGYENLNTQIANVGDVMLDAAMYYSEKELKPDFVLPNEFILSTIHRAENTDDSERLFSILEALNGISKKNTIILPLHPRTANVIKKLDFHIPNIKIIEPVGYLEMIYMLKRCKFVMTDSGGLQKEAFFFKKRCITLRDETEWVELVDSGYNTIVGSNTKKILDAYKKMNNPIEFNRNLYGNGNSASEILFKLYNF